MNRAERNFSMNKKFIAWILGGSIVTAAVILLLVPKELPSMKFIPNKNSLNKKNPITPLRPQNEEVRAVWISSIWGLDFPYNSINRNNPAAQQAEFISYLDELQEIGFNTVMVQVRPSADALYKSAINPWAAILTGTQGQDPGYDPLAFMIDQTHKRGMKLHAWINPYRVTTAGKGIDTLVATHPARLNPDMLISHKNALYYNPELDAVKSHIEETVKEIVTNYSVDGIHMDDYFYPAWYPLPAGEDGNGKTATTRRNHVNDMVKRIHTAIKQIKPNVEFGISPIGIWKDSITDITGSETSAGWNSYYAVYADTRAWIQNEWIDYVVPQIYWEIDNPVASYEVLVKWWAEEVKNTNVDLYIGQGIYKDAVAEEITTQILLNDLYPEIKGSVFFAISDIIRKNTGNVRGQLEALFGTDDPNKPLNLFIDTAKIVPSAEPYLLNGTMLVPLQDVAGALKLSIIFDSDTQLTITQGKTKAQLEIGKNIAFVNGVLQQLAAPVEKVNDTIMVPVYFLRDYLHATVTWAPNTLTISLNHDTLAKKAAPISIITQ